MLELADEDRSMMQILSDGEPLEEPPLVDGYYLEKYHQFLLEVLPKNILLTGRYDSGCFAWEESYDRGEITDAEYEKLQNQASYCDQFQYKGLSSIDLKMVVLLRC